MTAQEEREAIVRIIRQAMAYGYDVPVVAGSDECEHGTSVNADCIACYDLALEKTLCFIERGDHLTAEGV